MNSLSKIALERGLALNRRMSQSAANGFDWLFRRDTLIKSGHTWFELVYDGDPMAVRYYDLPDDTDIELNDGSRMPIQRERCDVPLVLVPPLGVTTETFDLMPQRSLVRYMAASGFKTYLVDWGTPTKEHAHLNLKDYSLDMLGTAMEKIRKHSGSDEVSLMGWCLGGLLCLLHQGQVQDPRIRNIVTVASPIDLNAGGAMAGMAEALNAPVEMMRSLTKFRVHTLDPARLAMPAWLTTLVFKMTDPLASITTYWDLLTGIQDREFVETYSTTSDYLNNMLIYPGGVMQDMAVRVVVDNQLASGKIEMSGGVAELDKIESSLLAFAGETDHLVPPEITKQIVDIVASRDTKFTVAPGGHMGVIIGSKAQGKVWAESAAWLGKRSSALPAA